MHAALLGAPTWFAAKNDINSRIDETCRLAVPALTSRRECRHGDKAAEMELVDFRTYVEAAEKLINENPLGLKRVALVTSEDPLVIEEASRLTALDIGTPATKSSHVQF